MELKPVFAGSLMLLTLGGIAVFAIVKHRKHN